MSVPPLSRTLLFPGSRLGGVVAVGSLVSGSVALALALYLRRHRGTGGANWFVLALTTQSLWCLAYGLGLLVTTPWLRWALEALSWIGMFWTGPLFLAFALEYTGRRTVSEGWLLGVLFAVPVVTTGLTLTTSLHGLVWTDFSIVPTLGLSVAAYTIQPWGFFAVVLGSGYAGVGVLLLIETVLNYGPLYRREAMAVSLSVLAPSVALVVWLFRAGPVPYLSLAPLFFLAHVALDGYAFVESGMFETNPTTRRAAERSVIDDIASPVFVLDTDHRVVEVNDRAATTFELDPASTLGRPIDTIIDLPVDRDGESGIVTTRTGGRVREFTAVVSPLTDPAGTTVGHTVVMQDVTDRRQREQRLSVLNRVLRHNLRNEMNVISGRAELIAAESEVDSVRDSAQIIRERAAELHEISERAHEFERVTESGLRQESVDVGELVADLVREIEDRFPAAAVDVETTPETTARTDRAVLQLAVSNLLHHLLENSDRDAPRVSIAVHGEDDGDTLVLTVSTDGAGVGDTELAPVELGQETDLDHATGIALWVTAWCVTTLGGDLTFPDPEDGTEVTIRLPRGAAVENR